jgi:hypothetical protein
MSDPKPPNDDELDRLLDAMDIVIEGEMVEPKANVFEPDPPEMLARTKLLTGLRDLIQTRGEAARLIGFVFVGVCEDGVTPVLYSVQSMTPTTARLLIAELNLILQRITHNLNAAEDYVPQESQGEKDEN